MLCGDRCCAVIDAVPVIDARPHTTRHVEQPRVGHDARVGAALPATPTATTAPSDRAFLHPPALSLRESTPDAEAFVVLQRVRKAVGTHVAHRAHLLGFPGGSTLLREERLWIR